MNFTEKNGKLIISREGRIDLSNAADTEKEMLGTAYRLDDERIVPVI